MAINLSSELGNVTAVERTAATKLAVTDKRAWEPASQPHKLSLEACEAL